MPALGGCEPVGGGSKLALLLNCCGAAEGSTGNPAGAATIGGGGGEKGFNGTGARPGTAKRGDGRAVAGAIPGLLSAGASAVLAGIGVSRDSSMVIVRHDSSEQSDVQGQVRSQQK
jgi:hypothetical protein